MTTCYRVGVLFQKALHCIMKKYIFIHIIVPFIIESILPLIKSYWALWVRGNPNCRLPRTISLLLRGNVRLATVNQYGGFGRDTGFMSAPLSPESQEFWGSIAAARSTFLDVVVVVPRVASRSGEGPKSTPQPPSAYYESNHLREPLMKGF